MACGTADDITLRKIGGENSLDFSIYYEKNGQVLSTFHDIPLFANEEKTLYNMIVEIPRWTNAKNEINKETPLNPIKQDIADGKPRFVPNVFPNKGYMWNYGAFPQTWEDPGYISPFTGFKGDNDPIDVIEIGQNVATVGEIKQVKILGVIGLLDQNETDWKVVVLDAKDPMSDKINGNLKIDIEDVEKHKPSYLKNTDTFFRVYKLPSGKKENTIAFEGEAQNKEFATDIVLETHEHWKLLVNGTTPKQNIQTINLSVKGSPYLVGPDNSDVLNVPAHNPLPPALIDSSYDEWFYVSASNI
ncbi:inorganic pyrophosphatase [Pilaira anomala]|nr:inorganic pyrophosphatase [Pilaira anomala]